MNENDVAALIATRTEPSQPIPNYPAEPTLPDPDANGNFVDKLLPEEQMTRTQLMDYFAVPITQRHDPLTDNYINTIYEWARTTSGASDLHELMRVINEQEMHMGSKLKPDRIRRLGEYIKISKVRQQLAQRERELYY